MLCCVVLITVNSHLVLLVIVDDKQCLNCDRLKKFFLAALDDFPDVDAAVVDLRAHPDIYASLKEMEQTSVVKELPSLVYFYSVVASVVLFVLFLSLSLFCFHFAYFAFCVCVCVDLFTLVSSMNSDAPKDDPLGISAEEVRDWLEEVSSIQKINVDFSRRLSPIPTIR